MKGRWGAVHQTHNWVPRSRGHLSEGRARSGIGPSEDPAPGDNPYFTTTRRMLWRPNKEVFRLEKALDAFGDSTGAEVDFLEKALAKAHEAARERPLEVQIKECREFISRSEQRLVRLEADRQAELALLTEGRSRLS